MAKTKDKPKPKRPGRKKKEPFADPMPPGKDPQTGHFLPGYAWWKFRTSHGPNPIYDSADKLKDACEQYFQWVVDNPLYEAKVCSFHGKNELVSVPKMRAMTIEDMCRVIGISTDTWENYRKVPYLVGVTREVDEAIRTQKYQGAAADLLNANIIARDLGLADKKELTGKDGGPVEHNYTISDALADKLAGVVGKKC